MQAADFQREKVKCAGGLHSNPQPAASNLKIIPPPEEIKAMRVAGGANVKTENIEGKNPALRATHVSATVVMNPVGVILIAHVDF